MIFSAASTLSLPTSSRIWPSACAVAWSIWRRVSSSRRRRSSSVSARTRSRCESEMRRASVRISSASLFAWPISARCSSSSARASSRARSASSIVCRIALAAVVDRLLDRAERVPLEHEQDDQAEADDRPDHQPRGDLDERVRAGEHQLGHPRRGRSRGSRRAGRRTRPPRSVRSRATGCPGAHPRARAGGPPTGSSRRRCCRCRCRRRASRGRYPSAEADGLAGLGRSSPVVAARTKLCIVPP